jgi:hypothetical protein
MSIKFGTLVEEVKKLSLDEKEELNFLLEKYLIEARREEIKRNYKRSLKRLKAGKIEFTSDINKLKGMLE